MQTLDIESGGAAPAKPTRPSPRSTAVSGGGGGSAPAAAAVRQALGFPGALEVVLLLSIANIIFSIACASATTKGWFVSKTEEVRGRQITFNVGWTHFKSDLNNVFHTDQQPINDFSAGGEAMGDLSFVGHLVSIFLSFAIVAYLYCVLAYGRAGQLGRHRAQARFLAMALLGVGTWLFSFSVVGFPSAVIKDFEASPYYFDDTLRPDWAWGLSFLVTIFTLFTGAVLMRASQKIDDALAAAAATQ